MIKQIFEFKKTDRKWHIPVLAGLCVGIPILGGYFTGTMAGGKLASMSALVILYVHTFSISGGMVTLMTCSFGMMLSFLVGAIFGFNPYVGALALGLFAMGVHLALFYLKMNRPPGNFFFIMIASVALCMPFDWQKIPSNIGYIGIGTVISCLLGLGYTLLVVRNNTDAPSHSKSKYVNLVESATFGFMVGFSLLIAHLLKLENPYWVPTSCAAVMQGASTQHIWQRGLQRVLGTLIGLGMAWMLLLMHPTPLMICVSIIMLQVIVEFLVVRNYAVAAIFITVLTIFLAESGSNLSVSPTGLIAARFIDILIGSIIGALGGWILYNEHVHWLATRQIRKTKIAISRKSKI